jgi:hypothetical protein
MCRYYCPAWRGDEEKEIETPMTKDKFRHAGGMIIPPRAVWFCALTLCFGLNAATRGDGARPVSARPVSARPVSTCPVSTCPVSTCPVSAMSLRRRGAPRLYNIAAEDSGIEIINR